MRMNITEYARQIAEDYQKSARQRIDKLLELDCSNYMNLGIDSTKEDRAEVKASSKFIYSVIQDIDESEGKLLLKTLDL